MSVLAKKKKRIAVLFSGGLDSTFLVYQALKEGHDVTPLYITIQNNQAKVAVEKDIAKTIWVEVNKEVNKYYHSAPLRDSLSLFINHCSHSVKFSQIPVWILGALFSATCDDYDEIRIGYVNGDTSIPYLPDVIKIWKTYSKICYKKQPKLVFPLIKNTKQELWNELPNHIRQLTFFCEAPNGNKDCGHCASCKRYQYEGLFDAYTRNQVKTLNLKDTRPVKKLIKKQVVKK